MGSWQLLFFLCVILIHCDLITAQMYNCQGANYTRDSSFSVNINLLLSSLSSHAIPNNKFYNTTIGQSPPDKVYGLYLCRGDVTAKACKKCVEDASKAIIQRCPTQIQSIVVYEECILRYANRSIFSNMEIEPSWYMWNPNNISNPDKFNEILNRLMDGLVTRATNGSSTNNFATDDANYINFPKIYGLVQCTPDLSRPDCHRCLRIAVDQIPYCCNATAGGRIVLPSCNIRFEVYPFYESSPPPLASPQLSPPRPPLPPPTITNSKGNSFPIIVVIVVPSVVAIALLSTTIVCYCSRKRKAKEIINNGEEITSVDSLQFEFDTINAATDNFSDANRLGKGGFGAVYKGRLSDGQEIAVKRLSRNSGQGEEQFKNEVLLVAKLQHRNLVKLLGFCIKREERLLIYEFVPNTSLDHFIFDVDPTKSASLNWEMRYKIIGGIARGLLYLHEDSRHRIVHRDLKVSNILLDAEMNPKIADFGMARLCVMDQTEGNTDRIVGT